MKKSQNIIGNFESRVAAPSFNEINPPKLIKSPNEGPKLLAHSTKSGCLFSATVTPSLSVTGTIITFITSPTLWNKNPGPKASESTIIPKEIGRAEEHTSELQSQFHLV